LGDKVRELPFRVGLAHLPPDTADFLAALLHFDPAERLSAAAALEWGFVAPFRDPDEEFVREPIDTAFESMDSSVDMWRSMIDAEMATMDAAEPENGPGLVLQYPELAALLPTLSTLPMSPDANYRWGLLRARWPLFWSRLTLLSHF
jgi:hypothetical protein